jgi:polyhydroxyalkanoate synthesis regulator phasin
MARARQKDLLTRLADRGEEAIQRLAEAPGAHRLLDAVTGMRDRVDELQKRVTGIESLEKRVDSLEKRLAKLEKPISTRSRATARRPATKPTSSSGSSS